MDTTKAIRRDNQHETINRKTQQEPANESLWLVQYGLSMDEILYQLDKVIQCNSCHFFSLNLWSILSILYLLPYPCRLLVISTISARTLHWSRFGSHLWSRLGCPRRDPARVAHWRCATGCRWTYIPARILNALVLHYNSMTSSSGWTQRHEKGLVCVSLLLAIWRSSRSRGFRRCILHLKALKLQPMTDTRCVLIQLSQFRLLSNKWKNMFDALRDAEPIEWSKCTKCAISMSTKLSVSCSTKNFAKLRQAPQTLCPGAIWAAGFGRILFRCGNKVISNCSKRLWDSQM